MKVLFVGQGRIGLPQALCLAKFGHTVYGYDKNEASIENLLNCVAGFDEPQMYDLLKNTLARTYYPVKNLNDIQSDIDFVIFAIGTGAPDSVSCLGEKKPEVTVLEELIEQLFSAKIINEATTIVLRTTLYLGSTDALKCHIENKLGKRSGVDYGGLCFAPERLMEGRAIDDELTLPKIIGAYNETTFLKVSELFNNFDCTIVRVTNPITAEFCKLADNAFRSTIFAFSNDMAVHASGYDVDIVEVINSSNKNYNRNNIPLPGFVSGYCLGKDPYIFEYNFQKNSNYRGFNSVWYNARLSNDWLVDFVVQKVIGEINRRNLQYNESKVLILGVSFKEDVDDFRMSHTINLVGKLNASGISDIRCYDPNYGKSIYTESFEGAMFYDTLNEEIFRDVDVIILAHRHRELVLIPSDLLHQLLDKTSDAYIYDVWNIWRDKNLKDKYRYSGLGFKNEK